MQQNHQRHQACQHGAKQQLRFYRLDIFHMTFMLDGPADECCKLHVQSCMMFWDHMTVSMYELNWL